MARASETGRLGEALILPPGYRCILLQVQHMEAQAMRRNITDEFLSMLKQWAPEGEIIHGYMVMDA